MKGITNRKAMNILMKTIISQKLKPMKTVN